MRVITGIARGRKLRSPDGYDAVSYTHLDVYKRQVMEAVAMRRFSASGVVLCFIVDTNLSVGLSFCLL